MALAGPSPLECGVCMEPYSPTDHIPKSLPCGHTFCSMCLDRLVSAGRVPCPVCKREYTVPVGGFSTNHAMIDMLDYTCGHCYNLGRTSSCPHCPLNLCAPCLDDHVKTDHSTDHRPDKVLGVKNKHQQRSSLFSKLFGKSRKSAESSKKSAESSKKAAESSKKYEESFDKSMESTKKFSEKPTKSVESIDNSAESPEKSSESLDQFTESSGKSDKSLEPSDFGYPKKPVATSCNSQAGLYNTYPNQMFGMIGSDRGMFHFPQAAAVDQSSGEIYIGDGTNYRICVYDEDLRHKRSFDIGSWPWDLCFTTAGNIAVTCSDHKIRIYDTSGSLKRTIGRKGRKRGEFDVPQGIATDSAGRLYVCEQDNQRVQVLDESGFTVHVLGIGGQGKLNAPLSAAVHPWTDQIYVADYSQEQVNIYRQDGQYEASIDKDDIPGVLGFTPRYVSFCKDGLLCISDVYNHCLHLVRDGHIVQSIGKWGTQPGEFQNPRGTAFCGTRDIIVCDCNNHRVQRFSADTRIPSLEPSAPVSKDLIVPSAPPPDLT